jgi:hypothetical protein
VIEIWKLDLVRGCRSLGACPCPFLLQLISFLFVMSQTVLLHLLLVPWCSASLWAQNQQSQKLWNELSKNISQKTWCFFLLSWFLSGILVTVTNIWLTQLTQLTLDILWGPCSYGVFILHEIHTQNHCSIDKMGVVGTLIHWYTDLRCQTPQGCVNFTSLTFTHLLPN